MQATARILISLGLVVLIAGVLLLLLSKLGITGARLPGDIYIKKENFTFSFPIITCIVISIVLTVIMNLINRR
jgi:hypothetical protein